MKTRLFTPGPTPVPEETLLELAKPVGYHRSAEAKAILAEVTEDLKYVFQTANPVVTLTSSGTGGMEAAVCSTLAVGEKAILMSAGRWGEHIKMGAPEMKAKRKLQAEHPIDKTGAQLREMMPWIGANKLVDKAKN